MTVMLLLSLTIVGLKSIVNLRNDQILIYLITFNIFYIISLRDEYYYIRDGIFIFWFWRELGLYTK